MIYPSTCVMNNIHNGDQKTTNTPLPPFANKYSSFMNQNKRDIQTLESNISPSNTVPSSYSHGYPLERSKRGAVAPLENIAEQLESVVIFTNGLILTEAVRTNNTSIGKIMIDSLMISQMPEDIDWIEKIGSVKLNPAETKEFNDLVTGMKDLKKTFDEGKPIDVLVDLIDKLNPVAFQSFSENAKSFLDLLSFNSSKLEAINQYGKPMEYVIRLSYTAEVVTQMGDFSALDVLTEVVNFLEKTNKILAPVLLERSEQEWKKYKADPNKDDNKFSLQNCLTYLQSVGNSITKPFHLSENATMAFNLLSAASHHGRIEELVKGKSAVEGIRDELGTIVPLLQKVKKLGKDEQQKKSSQNILTDLSNLKQSIDELKRLKNSLDWFVPLAQAVQKMTDLYKTGDRSSSTSTNEVVFLDDFKSYKCLPNGADSFNNLKDSVTASQPLSLEYILSGISARLPVMKEYVSIYNPIIQNSAGLNAVEGLSQGILNFMTGSNSVIENSISATIDDIVKDVPDVTSIVTTLNLVLDQIKKLTDVDTWEKNLESLNDPFILAVDEFDVLTSLLDIIPDYFDFVSKLQKSLSNLNIETADRESHFETMTEIFNGLPNAVKNAKKIGDIIKSKSKVLNRDIKKEIPKMQDSLKKAKNFTFFQLKPSKDVDLKTSLDNIKSLSSISPLLTKIKGKKDEIGKFTQEIGKLNPFSKLKKPITKEDVESTQQMLKGMKELKNRTRSVTESYQIARLMDGNPFGNDILDKMYKGMDDFRNIAKQVGSLKNVQDAIKQLGKANGKLAADITKFLDGVDVMEIVPVEKFINVLDVIRNIPLIISNLGELENWVRNRTENDQKAIVSQLKSIPTSQQVSIILPVVSRIGKPFADNILNLKEGFQMFEEKLTNVDCKKNPEVPKCNNGSRVYLENSNKDNKKFGNRDDSFVWTTKMIFIAVVISVAFGLVVFVAIGLCACNIKMRAESWRKTKELRRSDISSCIENFKTNFSMFHFKGTTSDFNIAIKKEFGEVKDKPAGETVIEKNEMIRFTDMLLYEKNRVRLESEVNGVPRVHASFITIQKRLTDDQVKLAKKGMLGKEADQVCTWIACQAPKPNDKCNEAMFEMLLQCSVKVIVQLCKNIEHGKADVTYCATGKHGRYDVERTVVTTTERLDHCTLKISDKEKGLEVTIHHFGYKLWPDREAPDDFPVLIGLMDDVEVLSDNGVVLVHCMAGVGRTMTFINMVNMTRKNRACKKVTIQKEVNEMREMRYKGVQTPVQYGYLTVLMAAVCARESPRREKAIFEKIKAAYEESALPGDPKAESVIKKLFNRVFCRKQKETPENV